MVRRKMLHLAVILSMLMTMVGFVLPAGAGASSLLYNPGALNFGSQQIGATSLPLQVDITNTDAGAVTITNITSLAPLQFAVNAGGCQANTLNNGQTCSFFVVFTPFSLGTVSSALVITKSVGGPTFYPVTGSGVSPMISFSPQQLSFGEQQIGTESAPQEIKFTNTGTGPVLFVAKFFLPFSLTDPNYNFSNDTCFPAVLGPGETCSVWVSFKPDATAPTPGEIDQEAHFAITAAGFPLDMSILLKGTAVWPKGNVTPSQLNFGDQRVFTYSAPQLVKLENTGTGPLAVPSDPDIIGLDANEFHIQNNHCQEGVIIPVAGNCTFEVNFRPTTVGVKTARVVFDNIGDLNSTVTLNGRGVAGSLSVDNGDLDFGPQQQGVISPIKKIKVTNTGTESVQIFALNIADIAGTNNFGIISDTCSPSSLAPTQSCEITVAFLPADLGDVSAVLDIFNSGNGGQGTPIQLAVLLRGVGTTIQGEISPVQLNFAPTGLNIYSTPQKVVFKNTGTGAITVPSDLTVTGSADFKIQSNQCEQGVVIPAGGECSFWVTFLPSATGVANGTIEIAGLTNFLVSLNAVGATGTATLSPTALNFGDQQVNVQSNPKTLTLTNTSQIPVLVNTATSSDNALFPLTNNSCNTTVLMPTQSCTADFSFLPTSEGPKMASASFATNAAGNPQSAPLLGNGVKAVAVFDASAVDFGNQVINTTSVAQTVKVTNKGPGNLLINSVMLTGANAGDYLISFNNGCAGQLAPNATCEVQVKFKPTAVGARNAFLTFDTNAAGAPNNVSLTGNGTPIPTYLVTLNVVGAGCTASAAPAGPYQGADTVTLTVNYNPATTIFLGWTIDGASAGYASPLDLGINNSSHNVLATCVAKPAFNDVNGATPYNDAILQLAARGVIKGYGNGNFGANDGILRAQMAAITVRLAGWSSLVKPNIFTDRCIGQNCIDDELWNAVAVTAFFQVARGYEDNTYRPFDSVANIQAVAFITRTMVKLGYWTFQPDNPAIYPNVSAGTGHRVDISTFYFYAGPIPGTNAANAWAQWDQPATRGYFAGIYWQAYASYFGVDQVP